MIRIINAERRKNENECQESCEKLEKSKVALTIEVSAEDFEAAINKAYLKMRGKMNIPGFRPGKAPRKIVEGMYGAEVFYEEAVNIALPDAYEQGCRAMRSWRWWAILRWSW